MLFNSHESEDKESKKRKVCRCGAGVEETANKCNTPGFPLRDKPKLVRNLQGFDRLELPRNHRRIIATSQWLVQGWRANCDIQILLYEGDPSNPDPDEIARVTDYIVAYACKGNESLVEEMKQNKALILGCEDVTGTTKELTKLARKLLNKTIKDKVISKQECMCHLAQLDLFVCSEIIETVSISGEYRLTTTGEACGSFLSKYANRDISKFQNMSLHQYFHYDKNIKQGRQERNMKTIIPHYVGARSTPTYPVKEGYAKSVIILHVPWQHKFNETDTTRDYIQEFKLFRKTLLCPEGVKIGYARAKERSVKHTKFVEPIDKRETIFYESFSTEADESVQEIVALAGTLGVSCNLEGQDKDEYYYGDDLTNWSNPHYQVCNTNTPSKSYIDIGLTHYCRYLVQQKRQLCGWSKKLSN